MTNIGESNEYFKEQQAKSPKKQGAENLFKKNRKNKAKNAEIGQSNKRYSKFSGIHQLFQKE